MTGRRRRWRPGGEERNFWVDEVDGNIRGGCRSRRLGDQLVRSLSGQLSSLTGFLDYLRRYAGYMGWREREFKSCHC